MTSSATLPKPKTSRVRKSSAPALKDSAKLGNAQLRTKLLIDALGSGAELARILGVSSSQPSRWMNGIETPGPETGRALVDLDHVMARALMLWKPKAAIEWLQGSNSYLDGARPIDVLRTRGSSEVVDALDAAQSGAFG
ncbi:antitoxin Xre/MbcA/ParS toxin-binding domain-containing protein [Arthrobacter sp. IK3]|uniref:antitoxin Xre/MbcA/ParS toxin-binding domain-containing protein n=1 Tax=Arthrobacter sp. IK3 TaxID=3448169 RepID=UPI003EE3ACC2